MQLQDIEARNILSQLVNAFNVAAGSAMVFTASDIFIKENTIPIIAIVFGSTAFITVYLDSVPDNHYHYIQITSISLGLVLPLVIMYQLCSITTSKKVDPRYYIPVVFYLGIAIAAMVLIN